MKLTTKQIMLLIMSTLLVLAIVMGAIVLNRVSGLLTLLSGSKSTTGATDPTPSESTSAQTQGTETPTTQPNVTTEPTEPHEHNYVKKKTVSATCTDFGYTIYACSCGKQDVRDMQNAKGHLLGAATIVLRTCEHDGYTEQMCSRCNQPIRSDVQKAKHKFGSWTTASASMGVPATQQQRTCSVCNCVELRNTATPDALAIRRYVPEAYGSYTTYRVVADLPDAGGAANEYNYQIYSQLADQNIHYNFSKSGSNKGLTLTYSVNGVSKTYTAPMKNNTVIAINSKGNVTLKTPVKDEVPTTPSTPSTTPTQPGTDPSTTPTDPAGTTPTESTGTTVGSTPTESTGATTGTTATENTDPQP